MGTWLPGPTLLGPMVHNQPPIVVPEGFQVGAVTNAPFGMVVASDGGLVLAWYRNGESFAAKLDTDNSVLWQKSIASNPDAFSVETLLAGLDGEVFLGGSGALGGATTGSAEAIVGKLTSNGDVAWLRQFGSPQAEWVTTLAMTDDGGVFGTGVCSDQIEGAPIENRTGPFLVRYEADGSRTFLRQHTPTTTEYARIGYLRDGIFLDGSGAGRIFSSNSFHQRSVDSDGLETRTSDPPSSTSGPRAHGSIHRIPGDQLFAYTSARTDTSSTSVPALAAFELDGTLKWYRQAVIESSVIDQAAGTTWTGEWRPPSLGDYMVVGADAVYVVGSYLSSYQNGPVEQLFSGVVAKYDFTGERIWFRLFRLPNQQSPTWAAHYLALGPDGNPVYALADSGQSPFIMRLSAADGSIIGE
jgi:hypothetical protein